MPLQRAALATVAAVAVSLTACAPAGLTTVAGDAAPGPGSSPVASSTASYQSFRGIKFVHSSAVKERFIPGAILAAIIAASIGNVPLPQNGSIKILSFFHGVNKIKAAANVSVIGALLDN